VELEWWELIINWKWNYNGDLFEVYIKEWVNKLLNLFFNDFLNRINLYYKLEVEL
jgi:hypothetical protein